MECNLLVGHTVHEQFYYFLFSFGELVLVVKGIHHMILSNAEGREFLQVDHRIIQAPYNDEKSGYEGIKRRAVQMWKYHEYDCIPAE